MLTSVVKPDEGPLRSKRFHMRLASGIRVYEVVAHHEHHGIAPCASNGGTQDNEDKPEMDEPGISGTVPRQIFNGAPILEIHEDNFPHSEGETKKEESSD